MTVTAAIHFPLGRYHATPWDRSVNEGAVEWPPSPWRLLRALIATWYTRWPQLPAPDLDQLLNGLADPPRYRTPAVRPGHTRHYLPDAEHRKGETGGTDLTLDPYLSVDRTDPLLVQWDADLGTGHRQTLAKLLELVPYLGRADSVCDARLMDDDPEVDDTWWRPGVGSNGSPVRLLALEPPISRPLLEATTTGVRKARRTTPPGTRWITYTRTEPESNPPRRRRAPKVQAIRLALLSDAPLKATHGILLADEVHRQVARRLPANASGALFGRDGATTDHRHAHWIPISSGPAAGATVTALVIWAPQGLEAEEVAAVTSIRRASGRRGSRRNGSTAGEATGDVREERYEVAGFPPVELLLQAAGPIDAVASELCRPARQWRSLTPYLPVRHQKREALDAFLAEDIAAELRYRGLPPAAISRLNPDQGLSDRWTLAFRRYRMTENLAKARRGLGVRLDFAPDGADAPRGPILLGQLSHFGYGIFVPEVE